MIRSIVLLVVVAVLGTRIIEYLYLFGYFKTIHKHYPGLCRTVPGIVHGSEDITVTRDGLAFISSGFRIVGVPQSNPQIKGKIFIFDFNHPDKNVVEVPLLGDFDIDNFYPHGISLYEEPPSGEKRLFVVNHHISDEDRIEIFRFDEKKKALNHLKSVTGENIYNVNDIIAIGPESFYYTVDVYFNKATWTRRLEITSGLSLGKIGLYDGKDTIIASGYRYPNGINLSVDGKYLYIATLVPGELLIFERNDDNTIAEVKRITLGTGLDNIEVDKQTGELWIGCHPILHLLFGYNNPGGQQVLKLRLDSDSAPFDKINMRDVLMDDGSLVKGCTVASYYDNKLLVGTVLDNLTYCEIEATWEI
ncbi:serum paraoxonase/arylesterase 1-like [Glandiceps talaboti]